MRRCVLPASLVIDVVIQILRDIIAQVFVTFMVIVGSVWCVIYSMMIMYVIYKSWTTDHTKTNAIRRSEVNTKRASIDS